MTITPELEKAARAVYEAAPIWDLRDLTEAPGKSQPIPWERLWEHNCDLAEQAYTQARAALQAMLPVSDKVVEALATNLFAGGQNCLPLTDPENAAFSDAFTAAISHIIGDGS